MTEQVHELFDRYAKSTRRLTAATIVVLTILVVGNIALGLIHVSATQDAKALSEENQLILEHLATVQASAELAAERAVVLAEDEVQAQERARINADIQVQAIKDAIRCLRRTKTLKAFDRCIAGLPPLNLVARPSPRPSPSSQPQPSPSPSPPSPSPSPTCSPVVDGVCPPGGRP